MYARYHLFVALLTDSSTLTGKQIEEHCKPSTFFYRMGYWGRENPPDIKFVDKILPILKDQAKICH